MHPYHPRPVISQSFSLLKPSDCASVLASRSEIHTAITFSVSVFAMFTRFSITVSILEDCQKSSKDASSSIRLLISGLPASCSVLFVYCSKKPVSWFAAALDSCISSDFLEARLSHPTMQIATTAMSSSTRMTLPPIWCKISSVIFFFDWFSFLC